MDVAAMSVIKSQAQLHQDVSTAVMKKAMDTAEQKDNFVDKMMVTNNQQGEVKQATPSHLGNNLDVRV